MDARDAGVEFQIVAAGGELAQVAALAREQIAARLFMAAPPVVRIADRYVLGDRIGAGGQGSVWRARDEQLDREVAIKVVHVRDLARDEAANLLLRREAQMLGRLAHPGVVAVFDLGLCPAAAFGGPRDDRMVLFVVMELVGGVGLDEWTRTGDRSTAEILDVLGQVAAGLAAVHACGLVHCDIKPSNILVEAGVAKLADFGLAHATRSIAAALDDGAVTDTSTFRSMASGGITLRSRAPMGGTPLYMAPEQMDGGVIDARADEYALAATLFEALYWRVPHEGKTLHALRLAKQRGAPPQPCARLGRRAYAALARSLAPDPAARHGDVRVAMRAIAAAQRSNRRRLHLALGGIGVVGALGFAMPTSNRCDRSAAPPIDEATASAVLASVAARGDDVGRRVAERVLARLREHGHAAAETRRFACAAADLRATSCLDRVDAAAHAAALAFADLDARQPHRALALVDTIPDPRQCLGAMDHAAVGPALDPDDGAAHAAWSQLSRARSLDAAGDSRAALDVLDAMDVGDADVLATEVMLARGEALHHLARHAEALAAFDAAYARADAEGASLDAARAAAGAAAAIGVELQRFDEGLAWVRHGEAHLRRVAVPSRIGADLAIAKGNILFKAGHYAESRAELERALAIAEGGSRDRVRSLRKSIAIAKVIDGDPDALEYMTETWERAVDELGEEHPDAIAMLANLGNAQARSGRYADGRASMERALELREAVFGPDAHDNAKLWSTLAELDKAEGDATAAIVKLRRAAQLRERELGEDHPDRAIVTVELAELLMVTGELDAAQRLLADNVDRFAAAFAAEHPIMIDFTHARGELALRRGRHGEAARLIGAAIDGARSVGLVNDDLPIWQLEAAAAEAALGHAAPAREYVDAAYVRYADLSVLMQGELDRMRATLPAEAQGAPPTYQR